LKGESKLFVSGFPVMERRHHLVVLEISLDGAAQNNLRKTFVLEISRLYFVSDG
jgi:hypothetical protein